MRTLKYAITLMTAVAAFALLTNTASAKEPVPSSTPGDVKTSNDDQGMNNDDAAHGKILENGKTAGTKK